MSMTPDVLVRSASFVFTLVWVTVLSTGISLAHVDSDSMPDSVAETEYRIFLEFKPHNIEVLNKLGMVYYRLNKLQKAATEFSKVLKIDSNNYDALDGMGLVKTVQQEYDEAIRYHQQAISINANDMVGHYHLGNALEKKGILNEAMKAYRKALSKFNDQYPSGTDNSKATEFAETIRTAIRTIETK